MLVRRFCQGHAERERSDPEWSGVTPQVNFPQKITFDTLYTNEFLLGVRSRALAIPSERTTI